jgi:ribonuclease HI
MGSVWHSLRRRTERSEEDLRALIHGETAYQDKLEAAGYRSPSWRILRALQGLQAADQLQGESAVSAPPFFRSAGRGQTSFWGKPSGPTVFLWESLDEEGKRACEEAVRSRKDWVVWSRTRPKQKGEQVQVYSVAGKAVFAGKVRSAQGDQQIEGADELSDGELEEEQTGDEARKGGTCRRRGWWKAGNIATSACPAGMTAWVHKECTTIDQRAIMNLRQAWDCAEEKDECTVSMTGLERDYWLGSEAGRVGSYEFQGAVFGINGSNHEGCMGSGCCRLGMPEADQRVRVGREEEGTSSNRPELGGVVLALKQAELSEDVLILCDNESVLKVIKKWIGQGGRATLADAPDADILREILELLRARIEAGRATFLVKVKSHRGEPMNERADTLAEEGRARPDEEKRWDARTDRMTFTITRQGTSKTSVWTDSVRNAFRKQAGRSKTQDMYEQAARNWSRRVWYPRDQRWMQATKEGRRAAKSGKFKDEQTWGKECFEDLERRDLGKPATTTWTTDFLVRGGESREELGKWLRNRAVPWKRRRRLIQVVTDTFPCGQWLHKIGRRSTAECELCRRIKEMTDGSTQGDVPVESIGHIQSAGCLGQSEVVTTAHNECIRGLIGDLQMHRKKRSNLTFLTMESEHTINTLWEQDGCSEICSKEELWEAVKEVEMSIPLGDSDDVPPEWQYEERFWRRRLDGIALDTVKKRCYLLEFKRTRDRRLSYEEKAAAVAIKHSTGA